MGIRKALLAVAAAVGLIGAACQLSSSGFLLSTLAPIFRGALIASFALDTAFAAAIFLAFGFATFGLIVRSAGRRRWSLAVAAALLAIGGICTLVASIVYLTAHEASFGPWEYKASQWSNAVGGAFLGVAGVLFVVGFLSRTRGALFGAASITVAAHFVGLAGSWSFRGAADTYGEPSASQLTAGLAMSAAGAAIAAAGAVVAAVAFFAARAGHRRERLLGVAATVFAAGFVASTIGSMVYASIGNNGFDLGANSWLDSDWNLTLMIASACAAVAFFSSRARSDQGDGADLAVLPDPA